MDAFTIKDLENLSGIKAHTLRIWEQRYSFLKPQRTETNIRYYTNEELKTILNIALLNKYGFKISHIDRMLPEEITDRIMNLSDGMAIQERIINELVKEMIDMEMFLFEQVLNRYIVAKGIEKTILQIIFPFLEKIGILWQTGHINPAQEHLVSNIIRQKLIVAIETTVPRLKVDKNFLLFLPEGEHHELGLLFMYYLIKSKGANAIYLGANVPLKDVDYVAKLKKIDVIFVHLTATATSFNFEKFLSFIGKEISPVPCIISGYLANQYKKKVPQNVELKTSLTSVMEYLQTIH